MWGDDRLITLTILISVASTSERVAAIRGNCLGNSTESGTETYVAPSIVQSSVTLFCESFSKTIADSSSLCVVYLSIIFWYLYIFAIIIFLSY